MSETYAYAQCDATLPRGIVDTLNVNVTPLAEYVPVSLSYYTGTVWPAVAPSIVGLCLYVAVLVFWIVWRSVRNCGCCCCCRDRGQDRGGDTWGQVLVYEASEEGGMVPMQSLALQQSIQSVPESSLSGTIPSIHSMKSNYNRSVEMEKQWSVGSVGSKSKVDIMTSICPRGRSNRSNGSGTKDGSGAKNRWQLMVLTGAIVMGLGVIGSSIYGMVTLEPSIVTNAVGVINTGAKGYIEQVLVAVQDAIDAGNSLELTLSEIEDQVQYASGSLGVDLSQAGNPVASSIASVYETIQVRLAEAENAVDSVNETVIGAVDDAVERFEPSAQEYNTYRYLGLYGLYGLAMFLVVMTVGMALVRWPFLHSLSLFVFMVVMVVVCAVMVAHAVGVKVGEDTCGDLNLENYVVDEVIENSTTKDVVRFYLSDGTNTSMFRDVYDVVNVAYGIDVRGLLDVIESVKVTADRLVDEVGPQNPILVPITPSIDKVKIQVDEVVNLTQRVMSMIEPDVVMNDHYAQVRGFFCCQSLDDVAEWWLGLTLTMGFGFVFVLFAFGVATMLDGLPLERWYKRCTPRSSSTGPA